MTKHVQTAKGRGRRRLQGGMIGYLNRAAAAKALNTTTRTLTRMIRRGESPPITRIGDRIYIREAALEAWLLAREGR